MTPTSFTPYWARKHLALATADCRGLGLTRLDDVEVIVKAFVGRAVQVWARGGVAARLAFARAEADQLRAVFYGRDPAYVRTPWNDPHQLGYALGCRANIPGDNAEEVMSEFWIRLSERIFSLLDRSVAGAIEEESADFHCAVEIEEARYALLGLTLAAD